MQISGAASLPVDRRLSWIGSIALAIAVGGAYFFAAQLSLSLLAKPDGVAVFWPAAGISSGVLIALGPCVRLSVTVGVVIACIVANLLADRSIAVVVVFALCNAGEPLLVAWLIKRRFGHDFRLESLPKVLVFFAALAGGPLQPLLYQLLCLPYREVIFYDSFREPDFCPFRRQGKHGFGVAHR